MITVFIFLSALNLGEAKTCKITLVDNHCSAGWSSGWNFEPWTGRDECTSIGRWERHGQCGPYCHSGRDCGHVGISWDCVATWDCPESEYCGLYGECLPDCTVIEYGDRFISHIHLMASTASTQGAGSDQFPSLCLIHRGNEQCLRFPDLAADDMYKHKADWWTFDFQDVKVEDVSRFFIRNNDKSDGWKIDDIAIIIEASNGDILIPVLEHDLNQWSDNEYNWEKYIDLPQNSNWLGLLSCSEFAHFTARDTEKIVNITVVATTAGGSAAESDWVSLLKLHAAGETYTFELDNPIADDYTNYKSDMWVFDASTLNIHPQSLKEFWLDGVYHDTWEYTQFVVILTTWWQGLDLHYVPVLDERHQKIYLSRHDLPMRPVQNWRDDCPNGEKTRRRTSQNCKLGNVNMIEKYEEASKLHVLAFPLDPKVNRKMHDTIKNWANILVKMRPSMTDQAFQPLKHKPNDLWIVGAGKNLGGAVSSITTYPETAVTIPQLIGFLSSSNCVEFERIIVLVCNGGILIAQQIAEAVSVPVFGFGTQVAVGGDGTIGVYMWKEGEQRFAEEAIGETYAHMQIYRWKELSIADGRPRNPYIHMYNPSAEVKNWIDQADEMLNSVQHHWTDGDL